MFPPVSPTTSPSDVRPTVPGPPVSAPPPCGVPAFAPLRVRGGGGRPLRRAVWRQRRAMAAGLALTAAALATTGVTGGDGGRGAADPAGGSAPEGERRPVQLVSAPVRIADPATVRLLRPGDRVDVIAGEGSGADARVVAKGARVAAVPRTEGDGSVEGPTEGGALVVLSVPRSTAASLAGAGISARLAVTLC
ncbi:hypothetical protein ABZV61_11360 [Streptomyces sp900116325]|uniref:Flp pilus assembly protein RcpC/CpaB domain-containing protein n=1 Tax=Streptomyces sp. 900116325 TaxID=3154295 RepID=A0ABV2U6B7_9ACTN